MYNAFALFSGIGHTVNYLVAQNYGSDDMDQGLRRMYAALLLGLGVGGIIALAGRLASSSILELTGASSDLIGAGSDYLMLRFYAQSFGIVSFVFHGFFRGVGDTRISMIVSILGNVIMLALTYGLAYGEWGLPQWGLTGAGYAFVIGEAAQLAACLLVFWGRMHRRFGTRRRPKGVLPEIRLIFRESGKLGLMEFSMSVSMYVFTMFVARLGDRALAANEVALNIMSFGFMPAFAFGSTATILVGQEIGRGEPRQARRAGTDAAVLGTIFLLLLGTAELVWAVPIARWYTDDREVYELAARLITISAYLQLFDGFFNFYAGGLRGTGDTTFLMRASMALNLLYFIPATYLFVSVLGWGSVGAWVALYSFLMLLGLSVMIRYYRTDWNSVRIKETIRP
jgi:putative MATE family efflux protein